MRCPFSSFSTAGDSPATELLDAASTPTILPNAENVDTERCVLKQRRSIPIEVVEKVDEERWILKSKRRQLEGPSKPLDLDEKPPNQLPPTPPPSLPLTPNSSTPTLLPLLPSSQPFPNYNLFSTSSTSSPGYFLQNSPFVEQENSLDLRTLSTPNLLLARALTILAPVTPAYAETPYKLAFNWEDIISKVRDLSLQEGPAYTFPASNFYIIVFRSILSSSVNSERLAELDKESHREANAAGNLLKYWFGVPNAERRNLATCVWRDISDAKKGGRGPAHRLAMQEVASHYLEWYVERLRLVVGEGVNNWDIVDW